MRTPSSGLSTRNGRRFFSKSEDIWQYLDKICKVFSLRRYMTFNASVVECRWKPQQGKWSVKYEQIINGQTLAFEETCDILLHLTGVLNKPAWPSVDGLDVFKGKVIHTASWPKGYNQAQWQKEKVAVIGSGASSIQTVPGMQHDKSTFRKDKRRIVEHAKDLEDQVNGIFDGFFRDSDAQKDLRDTYTARMTSMIKDEKLRKGFTPKFAVGCRRVTPGDPYIEAVQQPNVSVHFTDMQRLTENGVVGMDGIERQVDTVICATGFDVSFRPVFPVIGEHGVDLAAKWKKIPECYLGITIPGFPNLATFIGPTWPISNGSCLGPLDAVGNYAIQMIQKLQAVPSIQSFSPRQDLTNAFNNHVQEWIKHTVWADSCRSWYRNNETGRVNAVWPGSSLHYIEAIKNVRWEGYDITYKQFREGAPENPFSWLGMGYAEANRTEGADRSPYFSEDAIDERWWQAVAGGEHGSKGA